LRPQHDREAGRLDYRQGDGRPADVLGDGPPTLLALLALHALQGGDGDRKELEDNRRVDVGHDAQGDHRELPQRAAGERVEQIEHAAAARTAEERFERRTVDARQWHVDTPGIDHQDPAHEEQPPADVRNRPSRLQRLGHLPRLLLPSTGNLGRHS